ncbi:unnamed protein product [Protopolystoma xenopodis]|uniref:Ribosome biogenesis protein BMS1/TSR1 C-terminal domain-containing protein n=1 Tax=Protopolystoma xenopodis TaxID=117903 RepID=A0A3S5FGJ2_9PLAT|nr:unnamed protein product [Protopolystoma xenopodis]
MAFTLREFRKVANDRSFKEEHNLRRRFLKYSLDHDSCNMIFYGPAVPPKTGLIAFSPSAWRDSGPIGDVFRVTGTGSILETSAHCDVVKKLKLVGEPYRVFRKTVFIRGMFTSALEVSRMIGAKIETVSKIRGIIKAALVNSADGAKPGDFRATFEAPICKADLVFLRSFVMVELPPYYNPISNLLFPKDSEAITCHPNKPETSDNQTNESTQKGWRMMRTLGEMRRSMDLKKPVKKDSFYTPIERQPYISAPLRFSTSFVSSLPFKEKPRAPRSAGRVDPIARLRAPLLVPPSVDRSASVKHRRQQRSASDYVQHPSDDQESKLVSSRTALSRLRALHASWLAKKRRDTTVRVSRFKAKLDADAHSREQAAKAKRKAFFASGRGKGKRKS